MRVSDFEYQLPPEQIAQYPPTVRTDAKMLVIHRETGAVHHHRFEQFPEFIRPEDCLVINNTRVIPARIFGHRIPAGGRVEALLIKPVTPNTWTAFLKPGRRLKPDTVVRLENADTHFTVVGRTGDGAFTIRFAPDINVDDLVRRIGHVPLPPYIRRQDNPLDRERYQTVYAAVPGAVAAPTAGLHFTPETLDTIRNQGTAIAQLTLHVGPGTFRPVQTEHVEDHTMHGETYELSAAAAAIINRARNGNGRIIAVGTTSVRVLETCADPRTRTVRPGSGVTRIFLYPPQKPHVTDAILTNFHLPRSTLLMLVCTFADREKILAAYETAVKENYRFYSYGDCMLIIS